MGTIREPLRELTECGLPQALEVMGERWSFMILRASFNGLHHFEEFLSELGIARNILSNRLGRLVDHGILDREPCPDDRRRIEYRLTERGFDLSLSSDEQDQVVDRLRSAGVSIRGISAGKLTLEDAFIDLVSEESR